MPTALFLSRRYSFRIRLTRRAGASRSSRNLERQPQKRSFLEREADEEPRAAGSGALLAAHVLIFTGWIVLKRGSQAFDPYPFVLLNVVVSIETIILTSLALFRSGGTGRSEELVKRPHALELASQWPEGQRRNSLGPPRALGHPVPGESTTDARSQ